MTGERAGERTRTDFGRRLRDVVADRGPLCVGIDPHPELLRAWGLTVDARGVREFSLRALEAFGSEVAVIKPQVAFFEEHGSAGIAALEETLEGIRAAGSLSLADAKRGDIGSTMAAYARAWLTDGSPLSADALTVSSFLGVGALEPAFELAARTGRGLFVLAATSNPEAADVQGAVVSGGGTGEEATSLSQAVVDAVGLRNGAFRDGGDPATPGPFGVVVGATLEAAPDLSRLDGPVLMPGVGAQGATMVDVRRLAGSAFPAVLPTVSRQVLSAGPDADAMRSVVAGLRAEISA